MNSLSALYRRLTAAPDAQATEAVDVDALARLAAGEHLGARHDAIVGLLAQSEAHAAALRVAVSMAPAAETLAGAANGLLDRALPAHRGRRVSVRGSGRGWQWAALAASVAVGFALLLQSETQVTSDAPVAEVAPAPAVVAGDQILFGSFEEGTPAIDGDNGEHAPKGEAIFVDDFGA